MRAADVQMHVVVQEMVASVVSGVAFSRNPLTGLSDVVVEAVPGTGEALVSGRATPERWVRHWGGWTQRPDDPALPADIAAELSTLVAAIAEDRGAPIDLEWSWDGKLLYLLQVRPMTGTDVSVYSNRLAKEYLPGIVSPLVWSVNVPLVNGAWIELFASLVGTLSKVPWREDPTQLASLLDPPPAAAAPRGKTPTAATDLGRVDGVLARRTSRYRFERERVSYTYGRVYGQFRPAVLEMAGRLVERGSLDDIGDVFMLTRSELEEALLAPAAPDLRTLVGPRRAEIAQMSDVDMPEIIFGDDFDPAPPGDPDRTLTGIPSSRGVRRATARVVSAVKDATRVETGDIVVIPYSDIGWTPMLARAGGIVAESGGLLSHSSIVAREFGIPCVVSVAGAMRIPDGAVLRVDGFTGAVQWEDAA